MSGLAPWLLGLIFVVSAAVIWGAGIALSDTTDVLSERLHLGSALGGLILLAVATNLPELALWPFTESPAFGVTRNPWHRLCKWVGRPVVRWCYCRAYAQLREKHLEARK